VREYLAGNLCRCGTYPQILDAAARLVRQGSDGASVEAGDAAGSGESGADVSAG